MKKKNIFLGIVFGFIMLFTLTGCGNKAAISYDTFVSKAQANNLTIYDVMKQYSDYNVFKNAGVARGTNDWQVEFYVLVDDGEAINMFNINKTKFENYKGSVSSESSISVGNHSSYSLTSGGYYMHVSRIDNTLLYVRAKDTYKKDIKKFVKELGY